jgi:hypothetical protein
MITIAVMDDVGGFYDVPVLNVTDGDPVSHTISDGKKGIAIMNVGGNICWMGGSTINAKEKRGIIMIPRVYFLFRNAKTTLKIYFQCENGITQIGIIEYE